MGCLHHDLVHCEGAPVRVHEGPVSSITMPRGPSSAPRSEIVSGAAALRAPEHAARYADRLYSAFLFRVLSSRFHSTAIPRGVPRTNGPIAVDLQQVICRATAMCSASSHPRSALKLESEFAAGGFQLVLDRWVCDLGDDLPRLCRCSMSPDVGGSPDR